MFVLVRHGHAGDKRLWEGDDALRPLDGRGRRQAAGLVASLRHVDVTRLLSSPRLRCRQTLQPLAHRLALPVTTWDVLSPDADVRRLDRRLADPRLHGAVLCTHGETLDALFDLWARRRTFVTVDDRAAAGPTEKGAAWIVATDVGHVWARYLRPLQLRPPVLAGR